MTSLHVICGLAPPPPPPQSKILAKPISGGAAGLVKVDVVE